LHAHNADQRRYPASLTKMMTLYLLFEAIDSGKLSLNSRLRVSRRAAAQPPTKLGLLPGEKIKVRNAILALATQSANDVAVVVAEALAGNERAFAVRMTAKARALGMKRTSFRNASGLHHPRQQTTARDMALLGRALLRDHPRHYQRTFATRTFSYGRSRYTNHNRLLGIYKGMDGIKTGYTGKAGFNLVASARRGGRRIIAALIGVVGVQRLPARDVDDERGPRRRARRQCSGDKREQQDTKADAGQLAILPAEDEGAQQPQPRQNCHARNRRADRKRPYTEITG
jgi:D-alanyl-D-alanine carboxypeptidase